MKAFYGHLINFMKMRLSVVSTIFGTKRKINIYETY